jgi:hypothetical protein
MILVDTSNLLRANGKKNASCYFNGTHTSIADGSRFAQA